MGYLPKGSLDGSWLENISPLVRDTTTFSRSISVVSVQRYLHSKGAMPNFSLKKRSQSSVFIAVILTWLLLLPHHTASQTQIVTTASENGNNTLRQCVQTCLWGNPEGSDLLINLNRVSPWYDACL
jgi:hypothetical protein